MQGASTSQQRGNQAAFRAFVAAAIIPVADRYDQEAWTPPELIQRLAERGYLGAVLPAQHGGQGMDMITFGLLNEELGRGCSSLRSLLTVHSMVGRALLKWGSEQQKAYWIPRMATGQGIAAFALTEPSVGSDAKSVATTATRCGDSYVLNGRKKWITYGQIADFFLIFARTEGQPAAFLVEHATPGLSIEPISGMLGLRASMLAELRLEDCRIPQENLVGRVGFGISHVASTALDYGRYSVAWGCVGIAQACLDACLRYTGERKQFGAYLKDHQLIQEMLTDMITNLKAARLLCYRAGYLKENRDPKAIMETSIAKYFASKTAVQASSAAVQIHGANGCSSTYPVQRYLRDAKIMEIIEGSTQIQQVMIARFAEQLSMPH
jgi:glutaryl-CoA dehydrogenase (non-decarboxylating)